MADESDIGPEDTFEKKLEEGVRRLNEAVLQEEVARTEMRDVEIEVRVVEGYGIGSQHRPYAWKARNHVGHIRYRKSTIGRFD